MIGFFAHIDNDAVGHLNAETHEKGCNEVMGQRTLVLLAHQAHAHRNSHPHIHLYHKKLRAGLKENRHPLIHRDDVLHLHRNPILISLHRLHSNLPASNKQAEAWVKDLFPLFPASEKPGKMLPESHKAPGTKRDVCTGHLNCRMLACIAWTVSAMVGARARTSPVMPTPGA